ncbi:MAG: signal peptide protein [Myxococcales bacterium]|nr:signal peptide protein [Myxococcales bacterium]
MDRTIQQSLGACVALTLLVPRDAPAQTAIQCPGDLDSDAIPDPLLPNLQPNPTYRPEVKCKHLSAGDGFVTMADGRELYMFGFSDLTGVPQADAMMTGMLNASFPAPLITVDEGDELYLTLTNVGMNNRPDLFDPHTVHWHGFPNAAPIFDGVPDAAIAINMGASLTYYYKVVEPGTYMYHCHVEATEHMQMGMLGNLYVNPAQNKLANGTVFANGFVHQSGFTYAYNDGDGSTRYDVQSAIQLGSFDPDFHDADQTIQPLPFADMRDRYAMLNGRGYPDTVNPGALAPPEGNGGKPSQLQTSRVQAVVGQRILLRFSNLNVTRFYTLGTVGVPMRIVGHNARLLRGPSPNGVTPGHDLSYVTNSITLGGGESLDALIDTSSLSPGTYFLYAKDLNYLNNDTEDFGGMMTEIVITN